MNYYIYKLKLRAYLFFLLGVWNRLDWGCLIFKRRFGDTKSSLNYFLDFLISQFLLLRWQLGLCQMNSALVRRWFKEFGPSFSINFKACYLRLVKIHLWRENDCISVGLEEHVRKTSAKAGTVYVVTSTFGDVDFFTSGTEHLKSCCLW
jgi:hypothetical protein